ncbi:MAG TPA: type II toxin-antitoxin system RelE/ParE family toxin [Planctomycetaceae bacterium]
MATELIFTPEADEDVVSAYVWYERQRAGLGEEFLSCVEARVASILRNPDQFELLHEGFRRALVRRFPYGILFEASDERVTVYAVLHCSRDDRPWRRRLPRRP